MSARPPASLVVQRLSHRYRGADRRALSEVSLRVEPGERLGLLGPNGAGKSTLMRLVCGYLPVADEGHTRVEVGGLDVRTHSVRVRGQVGYMPEHVPLYSELRAREHLMFRARVKGVARTDLHGEVARVAELTAIAHVLDTTIGQLSRGYRQRVGLADALLGAPPLVVLDEPTVGLDPNQVRDVRAMLRDLGGNQTLMFSSHILAEVEMLCDRVVILSEGEVAADETIEAATSASEVHLSVDGDRATCDALVADAGRALSCPLRARAHPGPGASCRVDVGGVVASCPEVLRALGQAAQRAGVAVLALRAGTTRLEERFAEVTGARRPDPHVPGGNAARDVAREAPP